MKITITVCDLCGSEGASPVRLQPLAIGMFEEPGVFKRFDSAATGRFNTVQADICEACAEHSEYQAIVQYTTSEGTQKVMFGGVDPKDE